MAMRERHALHYLERAMELESAVLANTQPVTEGRVRRLYLEIDNLRGAIAWLLDHDPIEAARLASALDEYWFRFGYFAEGRAWLQRALDRAPGMPRAVRRRVLDTSGWLAYQQGDLAEAERRLAEAAPLHRASGDLQSYAWALGRLANVALARLEPDRARELLEEARRAGREIGDQLIETAATSDLGRVLIITGEIDRAEATLREAVRQHRARPGTIGAAVSSLFLGSALVAGGKMQEAARSYAEAMEIFVAAGDWANVARCAEGIASAVVGADPAAAARLLGATTAIRDRLGHPVDGEDQPAVERTLTQARERVPERVFAAAWSDGQALAWDAVAREAAAIAAGRVDDGAVETAGGLTQREHAVLALLVDGRTDAEIADALFISRRTAATHIQHIYRKLGVASRAEAAGIAIRRGLA
jgi:non-specific serine/threonine protein kinase